MVHEGEEVIVVVQEGYTDPIARFNGKTCLFTKSKQSKKLRPGDIIKGVIKADKETYYIFHPKEIVKRPPKGSHLFVVRRILDETPKGFVMDFKRVPVLRPHSGKELEVVLILPDDRKEKEV